MQCYPMVGYVTWHMPHIPKQGGRVRNRSKHFIQWGNVRCVSFKVGRGGARIIMILAGKSGAKHEKVKKQLVIYPH